MAIRKLTNGASKESVNALPYPTRPSPVELQVSSASSAIAQSTRRDFLSAYQIRTLATALCEKETGDVARALYKKPEGLSQQEVMRFLKGDDTVTRYFVLSGYATQIPNLKATQAFHDAVTHLLANLDALPPAQAKSLRARFGASATKQ
jgi:hypothetical protein